MLNLRDVKISVSGLIVIVFLSMAIQAKVAPAPIEQLITSAQLIVVGKVSSVQTVEGVKFAKVEILQTLKGPTDTSIYYAVERQVFGCDISNAVKDETALFFFNRYTINLISASKDQLPDPFGIRKTMLFKDTVEKLTNHADLFRLSFNGRGRMPVEDKNNEQLLRVSGVILPGDVKPELNEIVNYTNKVLSKN